MPASDLEIVVGTYEEFLLGYKVSRKENNVKKFHLIQSFADHSHRASIRSVCAKGKYLASGSADETITLYDMKSRRESGILVEHNGIVSCISFSPNGSHLLSGSEDGSIAIFRAGSWQLEKVFPEAHKGAAVTLMAVHPSGKLALTVGTDATLRTWNLVKGRQAYATNLGKSRTGSGRDVSCLLWSPEGNSYVLAIGSELNVYDIATAGIVYSIKLGNKITSTCFIKETELVIGDDGGTISIHSIPEKKQLLVVEAHKSRVKCLSCVTVEEERLLVSAASSGEIKLWKCKVGKLKRICSTNSDCRITCLVVLDTTSYENTLNKEVKEEVENQGIATDKESDKSKRKRRDSEGSLETKKSKTIKDAKNKGTNSSTKKSVASEVVCTRGQKWLVEDV